MKIQDYSLPQRDTTTGIPEEVAQYLSGTFTQVRELTTALQGRLSVDSNVLGEVRTLELKDDTDATVTMQRIRAGILGVILLWSEGYDYARLKWKRSDRDKVTLAVKWDTTFSGEREVIVLVLGEERR